MRGVLLAARQGKEVEALKGRMVLPIANMVVLC